MNLSVYNIRFFGAVLILEKLYFEKQKSFKNGIAENHKE
jgi:hypothetical protein